MGGGREGGPGQAHNRAKAPGQQPGAVFEAQLRRPRRPGATRSLSHALPPGGRVPGTTWGPGDSGLAGHSAGRLALGRRVLSHFSGLAFFFFFFLCLPALPPSGANPHCGKRPVARAVGLGFAVTWNALERSQCARPAALGFGVWVFFPTSNCPLPSSHVPAPPKTRRSACTLARAHHTRLLPRQRLSARVYTGSRTLPDICTRANKARAHAGTDISD